MHDEIKQQLVELMECYRSQCPWFLAEDFVPETPAQAVRVLEYIERYGDREGFVQARRLKLQEAAGIRDLLPTAEVGKCVVATAGELYRGPASDLCTALEHGAITFHAGTIRGVWPQMKGSGHGW